jgi:ATP-dependent Clp protease protease subunit
MLKVNASTGEIYIYDVIGNDWYGEGITGKSIADALDSLNGAKATIRINSPGGVADEGIAIYNALKRYPGGVDTINDALAASAASIVFLAGESRIMSRGSRLMIHRALTVDIGNAPQFRKTADKLEQYDKSLAEIYSDYLGEASEEEIMKLMGDETWYTVAEAVEAGLANGTAEQTDAKPKMAAWFSKPPVDLVQKTVTNEAQRRLIRAKLALKHA